MRRIFVFCHGFAYSPLFWEPIKQYFLNEECVFLDLGYFLLNKSKLILPLENNIEYIGVGHSLGLTKLLQLNITFKYLIGLNGFINFLGNDIPLRKKRSIELKFLKQTLINNEIKCLEAFYKRCGLENWISNFTNLNKLKLLEDLCSLEKTFILPKEQKTLIIASENDIIIPKILINDNFSKELVSTIFLKNGEHALGFKYPNKINNIIRDFLYDKF